MTELKTKRTTIHLSTDDEIRALISKETDPEMIKAYGEMLEGAINNPLCREWYAPFIIKLTDGTYIGDLCFKGLSSDGITEIGYGFSPEYWGKGYATEVVHYIVSWAFQNPKVKKIEAETLESNIPSQRVLIKCGFVRNGQFGEEGPRFEIKRVDL